LTEVIRTGQPRLVRDVRCDTMPVALRASTDAQLTVPLASPRGILGAITLESDRVSAFDDQDVSLVTLFAQQATVIIERALLHHQLTRHSRLRREIEIAGVILKGLTPTVAPALPGVQVFGRSFRHRARSHGRSTYTLRRSALMAASVVLGKHVPGLEFVGTLLAETPALAPEYGYYERLLARDQREAADLIERYIKTEPPCSVYDALLLPALNYAERDRMLVGK
jgi:GAF domain